MATSKGVIRYYVPKGSAGSLGQDQKTNNLVENFEQREYSIDRNMKETKQRKQTKSSTNNNNRKKPQYQVYYEPKKNDLDKKPELLDHDLKTPEDLKEDRCYTEGQNYNQDIMPISKPLTRKYKDKVGSPDLIKPFNFQPSESISEGKPPLKFTKSMSGEGGHKRSSLNNTNRLGSEDSYDELTVFSQTTAESTNFSCDQLKEPSSDLSKRFFPPTRTQSKVTISDWSKNSVPRPRCQTATPPTIMSLDIFVKYQLENKLLKPFRILSSQANRSEDENCWFYVDPNSEIQGPFSSIDMDTWYLQDYFNTELLVCFTENNKFSPLREFIDCASKLEYIKYYNLSHRQAELRNSLPARAPGQNPEVNPVGYF